MQLEDVLGEWRNWPLRTSPVVVKEFSAGLNHRTYLLKAQLSDGGQQLCVLKIFTANGLHEVAAQRLAAESGVAPNIIFVEQNERYVLMEALSVECLADHSVAESLPSSSIDALANALRALHQIDCQPQSQQDFNILAFCELYLRTAGEKAQRAHWQLKPLIEEFVSDATPPCFCHNDLVRENCFIGGDQAWFIDWEYADRHNPWFDLAAIVSYSSLSEQQSKAFITAYNPAFAERLDESILSVAQVALLWGDILWHLAKFGEAYWPMLEHKWQMVKCLAAEQGVTDALIA